MKNVKKILPYKKIKLKSISNTISNNNSPTLPSLTQSYTSRHISRKIISPPKDQMILIETQVSSALKKIEIDKINLRIIKERLMQKRNLFNTLEGKGEKSFIKKQVSKNKFFEPIKIKKGKERELIDAKIKSEKEREKAEYDFKKVTGDIDDLIKINMELKKQIDFQRIKKVEMVNLRKKLKNEINYKQNKLKELMKNCNFSEIKEKKLLLNEEINNYKIQKSQYEITENYLEKEYNKIIQAYIKKEREDLIEEHFNKQITELRNKGNLAKYSTGKKGLIIQKELEKYENEKIDDRTPILDEILEKWRKVNYEKKNIIKKYSKNCLKVRESFNKLIAHLNVDSYNDLPEIFKKTEERQSNISIKLEKIQNENHKLEQEKQEIISTMELIKSKKEGYKSYKNKFIEQKKAKIELIENTTQNFKKDIKIKEKFFECIQPITDKFLKKLNNTYISEFLYKKMDINENIKYNYLTINKFLSNVEDYLNLIQEWKDNNDTEEFQLIEEQNFDELNDEFKKKLDNFDKNKLINNTLAISMQLNRKNGIDLDEIIKSTSKKIIRPINYNNIFNGKTKLNNKFKNNKSKERTTVNTDEDYLKNGSEIQS